MVTERMIRQGSFLKDVLREAKANTRRQKLLYANADQINALSELVMNTLRGLSLHDAIPYVFQNRRQVPYEGLRMRETV